MYCIVLLMYQTFPYIELVPTWDSHVSITIISPQCFGGFADWTDKLPPTELLNVEHNVYDTKQMYAKSFV